MFDKILIANRGEIACRIIRTARRLGIRTVAVFSEADKDALHVEMADEAVFIGPAAASHSYLVMESIIDACQRTGAQAVHPGYGFLSERAAFAKALAAEDIVFIGPNPRAIEAMGDKIESKKFANAAEVSTVPGYLGAIDTPERAVEIAEEIGYPVMIKASAGGGGKGMRIAHQAAEVREGFVRARSEALSSFGDDRVFIEKFIVDPRHIEIQVLGDKHGNIIYLGERECSIQRRNQKVIEEAPSPLLDEMTRRRMGEQSVALARAVGYDSAGTVEFVAGQDKSFFFLEMNTRLQVEHPVTEMITGIDLVEEMIRIAAGEKLRISQSDVRLNGWAIESRIYAEDPSRDFMPSTGRLVHYRAPQDKTDDQIKVRVDSGVIEGSEISVWYDPMIAKLVTWGSIRREAIAAQADALDEFVIRGINHNIPFLGAIMDNRRWIDGRLSTAFIKEEFGAAFSPQLHDDDRARTLAAVAAFIDDVHNQRKARISRQSDIFSVPFSAVRHVHLGQMKRIVSLVHEGEALLVRDAGGQTLRLESGWQPGEMLWRGRCNGDSLSVQVRPVLNGYELCHRGVVTQAVVYAPREAELAALMPVKSSSGTGRQVKCPMPGLVVSVSVTVGQEVKAGDILAVVEAMKMENILRAERDGVIKSVNVKAGDSLNVDALMIEFE